MAFTSSLYAGSLGGILLGCLLVVLASLPLCFGRLKEHRQARERFIEPYATKLEAKRSFRR